MRSLHLSRPFAALAVPALISVLSPSLASAQTQWMFDGGPEGGRVAAFDSDGGEVYAAMSTGVFHSADAGLTWQVLHTMPVGASPRSIDAHDGVIDVPTMRSGILRSPDGGSTWQALPGPIPGGQVLTTEADAGHLYAVAAPTVTFVSNGGGLFETHDDGATWTPLPTPGDVTWVHADGDVLLTGTPFAGIYRSGDGGATWSALGAANGLPSFGAFPAPVAQGGALYLASASFSLPDVLRSDDAGQTWVSVNPGLPSQAAPQALATDGQDLVTVTANSAGSGLSLWRSGASGQPWTRVSTDLVAPDVTVSGPISLLADGGAVLVGAWQLGIDGVLRSADGGVTWAPANTGLAATGVGAVETISSTVLGVAGNSGKVWRRAGGGDWMPAGGLGADAVRTLALTTIDETTLLAGTGSDGIFRSDDQGASWESISVGVPFYDGLAGSQRREIQAFCRNGTTWFAGTGVGYQSAATSDQHGATVVTGGGILRSTDRGNTWQIVNNGFPIAGANQFGVPYYQPILSMGADEGVVYVGTLLGGVYRSLNDGASWAAANNGLPLDTAGYPTIQSITGHNGMVFLAAGSEGLFHSSDHGQSWFPVGGLPDRPVKAVISDGQTLYAALSDPYFGDQAGLAGVYSSPDDGITWRRVGDNGDSVGDDLALSGRTLFAPGAGGVWAFDAAAHCAADFDANGTADVFDLLAYLTAWFGQDSAADVDASGSVDVFDLLAFLGDWFTGC